MKKKLRSQNSSYKIKGCEKCNRTSKLDNPAKQGFENKLPLDIFTPFLCQPLKENGLVITDFFVALPS